MDIYDEWRSASEGQALNFRLTFMAVNGIKQGREQTNELPRSKLRGIQKGRERSTLRGI